VRRYDLGSTLFLLLLAVYVVTSGFRLGFGQWREPGPGFLAVLAGAILAVVAGVWFLLVLAGRWSNGAPRRFFSESGAPRKVALTALALIGYALLLTPLGFPLATLLFMVFLLRAIQPQPWGLTLVLSCFTMIVCVIVFQVWLRVQFPDGLVAADMVRRWVF
jgi:hypothetical protein